MHNFTLGLDLGSNSIGWALVDFDENEQAQNLRACGSRIFQEAVEAKTGTPKNHARRAARAARKLVSRRKRRRNKLLNILVKNHLLPQDLSEREKLLVDNKDNNPYLLRKKALYEKLDLLQFGRAIFHLAHRRGFQSNRKSASEDDGKVKAAISLLQNEINNANCQTLGEYLASQDSQRCRYTDRAMYQHEFEKIWDKQSGYYPDLLNAALKVSIHNTVFFQRPLKNQKHLVGKCTFEPSRKRAAKAILLAQRFRILQDVNHLQIKNPITREYRLLKKDERDSLVAALEQQKSMTWGGVRKELGWNQKDSLHEGETFNLEEGNKDKLLGNRTACDIRAVLRENWDNLSAEQKDCLVTDILTIENEQGFLNRMLNHWQFDAKIAESLAKIELEPSYARLSTKAMRAILPYLAQGMIYSDACAAAGYNHSNPQNYQTVDKLGLPANVRNPIVQKALFETRKVVNAIIRQYGKPSVIRIEMARDMKLSKRQKEEVQREQNKQKKANEIAENILKQEFGIQQPSRVDIQKYQMWLECKEACPYTGFNISRSMLFSSDVDVEHILPYSRTLDDSYMNKTLCMAAFNRQKKLNNTPYEIFGSDANNYEAVLHRIKTLPAPKRRRFEQKEVDTDAFITRQLNDTRYICIEVKNYLQQLGCAVEVSKGEATAKLRRRWQLNTILSLDGKNEKNRADHRHHAIDAIVIALTNKRLFYKVTKLARESVYQNKTRFDIPEPWDGFYDDVYARVDKVIVSHAPARKISGALHEDTAYGYFVDEVVDAKTGKISFEDRFVYRKALSTLTANEVMKIRDAKIKEIIEKRYKEHQGNSKSAFSLENPLYHLDGKTPIKTVRLVTNFNKAITHGISKGQTSHYKFFKYGNNHHVEIIENIKTGKRKGIFVTALEAAKRVRNHKEDIFQKDHGVEWKFIMTLAVNDLVETENKIYRVQLLDGSNEAIVLRVHSAATLDDNSTRLKKTPNSLQAIKISIDPLGNISPCND